MLSYENARFKTAASADCNGMSQSEVLLAGAACTTSPAW